jgi:hypothetical protein
VHATLSLRKNSAPEQPLVYPAPAFQWWVSLMTLSLGKISFPASVEVRPMASWAMER